MNTSNDNYDYSDYINWLDGITPMHNVIGFMTTNHVEKLKPSVIRNGRVDQRIFVPYLNHTQLTNYIGKSKRNWINKYPEGKITISMIPELRLMNTKAEFDAKVEQLSHE